MTKVKTVQKSVGWSIFSRAIAAILGGYIASNIVIIFLSYFIPLISDISTAQSLYTGMTVSFIVYLLVAIWVFSARTATKAWAWLAAPTATLGALSYVMHLGAAT